jgi:poly(3-hydroxybutyrate) depolymerase
MNRSRSSLGFVGLGSALSVVVGLFAVAGCGNSGSDGVSSTGGSTNTGGGSASGGSVGGSIGSGGIVSPASSGGATSQAGSVAVGGATSSGGSSPAGGTPVSGGSSGLGGATSTGGTTGIGGSAGTGGGAGTGGTTATGGNRGRGGRTGEGGSTGSGGATATGGSVGSGGATDSGGSSTTGGATGSGGGSSTDTKSSAGCSKTPTLTSGAQKIGSRNYMIRIPPNYDNTHPYPLVFAFHWNGGNMNDVDGGGTSGYTWSYYGLREQADNSTNSKMIFVAPDGNGGWPNSGGQDLTFVDDLLKKIQEDLCVDTSRIFSMGFSYGGGMSFELACARANVFRAVAVYSGAQLSGCDGGKDPIAYIGFHSVSDGTCNYSGGESLRNKFVTNDGCTPQTPPKPGAGNGHVCTSFEGCKAGYPVRWCAFDGGGHTPAPVDGQTSASGGGDKTWTKEEAWKFFTQF